MTRELAITKRQAVALMRAAKEERSIVEVQTAIGIIRIIPGELYGAMREPLPERKKGVM
jgi:hypothetical protein